jgi:hypothetical protein
LYRGGLFTGAIATVVVIAAVVIGGLITSTLLTLYILPTLYRVFERHSRPALHPLPEPPSTKELIPV